MLDGIVVNAIQTLSKDFFSSLEGDANALMTFVCSWNEFYQTIQLSCEKLQAETLDKVHTFAATVDTIASGILELQMAGNRVYEELTVDLNNILGGRMNQLTIADTENADQGEP